MIKGLFRDIKSQKGWLIAIIILVALSSGIYSSFRSTYDSAINSVNSANENLHSSDIIAAVAPGDDLSADLKTINGISMVTPVFSTDTYTLVGGKRIRGQVSSVPLNNRVDNYQIIDGKDLADNQDIVVEHHYAAKNSVVPGDEITLYINGTATKLNVAGIYFSPNNLYMVSPEGWIENDFGYFIVPAGTLGSSQVNEYRILAADKSRVYEVVSELKSFFAKQKIGVVVMPTEKMLAKTAFEADAGAMNSLADMFTVILLFISAFIFFIVLSRNVERKRREIGIYRAMGFSKAAVFNYFISFSGLAVTAGIILSIPIAYGLLVFIINFWGTQVMEVPSHFLVYNLDLVYVGYSALFAVFALLLGATFPSIRAASIRPAEAMKSYRPSVKGARIFSKSAISVTKKLTIRDLFGHRLRSISTIIAIALVLSLGISFAVSMNSYIKGIDSRFSHNELWDIRVNFSSPKDSTTLNTLSRIKGVKAVEAYRGYGAEISKDNKNVVIQFSEMEQNTEMSRFSLSEGKTSTNGVIISGDVAYRLNASAGDIVTLSTPYGKNEVAISGIFNEFGSSEGYQLTNIDNPAGALLKILPSQLDSVENSLEDLNYVKSWVRKEEFKNGWHTLFKEFQGMTYAMDFITVILSLLIVGIFAFISTAERRWEFVILKLIGFSNKKILSGTLVENLILAFVGSLLGIPVGMQIATAFGTTFQELMSPPPTVFALGPIIARSLLIILVTLLTVYTIAKLDLRRNVVEKVRRLFGTT